MGVAIGLALVGCHYLARHLWPRYRSWNDSIRGLVAWTVLWLAGAGIALASGDGLLVYLADRKKAEVET